ncbi:Holo-[acyl-carrier-protein] synthase [Purpureocillium takamizusanense]|uniref:Holo-[acyl-carrier-protein] synthase n=1 Tax=Purpureocillium takamizusanense TaxID=2060973 RepID=A0A9Q8VE55_9HYPO|nr:Holo-[acyl-carrier-protein] synthase [Purpureocillium takamizusanense]UNI21936.1 Holo-[acyl-carrier-protein] synthase [Purpureocillium takamizusanense]
MKPLRAFPFPLNVGTDICQISRIYSILRGPRRARFVNRILAPEELAQKDARLDFRDVATTSSSSQTDARGEAAAKHDAEELTLRATPLWQSAAFLAGRFAAKEAAIKAHSHRRLTLHDVIIERRGGGGEGRLGSGPPVARIRAGAGRAGGGGDADGEEGEQDVSAMISISHDGDYATAVCLAYDPSVMVEEDGKRGGA